MDQAQRDRWDDDGGEVFPPTADGIGAWVASTRPTPPRPVVVEHVRDLIGAGLLAGADAARLARAYPEIGAS